MTRPARITFAVVGTTVIAVATTGASWSIAALDGPLWSIVLVIACGFGALMGLARGLKSGREPSWREREGRRDGYVSDGGEYEELELGQALIGSEICITHPDGATDLDSDRERLAS